MILSPQDRFDYAVKRTIQHEGGFSDNPKDPGGATQYGISLRFLKDHNIDINHDDLIDVNDIKDLHVYDAEGLYKKYFWDKYHYEGINWLPMAAKIFDMSVNMGGLQAHKIVQSSCNYCDADLAVDGIMGIHTLAAINRLCLGSNNQDLMAEVVLNQEMFYKHLVDKNSDFKIFLQGWLNRAAYKGT